jgi:hypothetical protein
MVERLPEFKPSTAKKCTVIFVRDKTHVYANVFFVADISARIASKLGYG